MKLLLAYLMVGLIVLAYDINVFLAFPPESGYDPKFTSVMIDESWVDEYGNKPLFVASEMTNPWMIALAGNGLVLASIAYGLILFFDYKIYKKLKASKQYMSQKTKTLNKQLNWSLISQAINPILTTTLPVIVSITCAALRLKTNGFGLIIMSAISWVTVLNPLCTLIFVGQYRKALWGFFRLKFRRIHEHRSNSSKVAPIHVSAINLATVE